MLQKLKKSSIGILPINLPPPPTMEQVMADLSKLHSNDPLFQIVSFDNFSANARDAVPSDGVSIAPESIFNDLSKISHLCDEIRDADVSLGQKRIELQSLISSAIEKREELEDIVTLTTAESVNGENSAEDIK